MKSFRKNYRLMSLTILVLCIAIFGIGIYGCAGAGTSMIDSDSKSTVAIETTAEAVTVAEPEWGEGYDVCYSSQGEAGSSYYLLDLDNRHIKFFSTIQGIPWFEDDYEGDLTNGLSAMVSDDITVQLSYADPSKEAINADYSYGESYTFDSCAVSDAEDLLDENGWLINGYDTVTDVAEATESAEEQLVIEETAAPEPDPAPYQEPVIESQESYVAPVTHTYVLNTNTHKIHITTCKSVDKMKESNKQFVEGTLEQILSWYPGYTVCGNCHARY